MTGTATEAHPLIAVIEDQAWTEFALCRGRLDLFFEPFRELAPQRAAREQVAKDMCAQCPVQLPCRESARRNHESGIWGGETEEDRVRAGFPIRTVTRTSLFQAQKQASPAAEPPARSADPEVA